MNFVRACVVFMSVMCLDVGTLVHSKCMFPPPATNFTLGNYYGLWYEVGKIQTSGGAVFEKDCVCTSIEIGAKSDGATGDCSALNSCRKLTPEGKFLNATGKLVDMSPPGKWKEAFFVFVPKVDYTVIYLDQDFAVEYDCSDFLGVSTNYCIHIMARVPRPDPARVQALLHKVLSLGLNTDNLPYKPTLQEGCW